MRLDVLDLLVGTCTEDLNECCLISPCPPHGSAKALGIVESGRLK